MRSEEILEYLPEAARQAFVNGTTWEYSPGTIEAGQWFPWNCGGMDGCTTFWHNRWFISGYSVEDGHLYEDMWEVDSDGNWEINDSCDVDSEEYEEWAKVYSYEEAKKAGIEYAQWVAEHGEDPLGEYSIAVDKIKREYTARLQLRDEKFWVTHLNDQPVHRRSDLPQDVQLYLLTEAEDSLQVFVDWSTIEEFIAGVTETPVERLSKDTIQVWFSVDEPRPEEEIAALLRESASRQLREDNGHQQSE